MGSARTGCEGEIMSKRKFVSMAICYDFDGTLAPGNMQEHNFLPALGIGAAEFWTE